jgi:predicted permease
VALELIPGNAVTDDLKQIWRSVRARPGPSVAATVCLALGIGVNIAIFGLLDALLLRPPVGVSDAESLVRARIGGVSSPLAQSAGPSASYPQYERIARERADLLAGLAAYGRASGTLGAGADAVPVRMEVVTGNFFSVLGVRPRLGRFFDAEEGAPRSGAAVAVLSHRYWVQSLAGDRDVTGRSLDVNGFPLRVIGVAREGFVGADLGGPDVWVPMGLLALPEFGGQNLPAARGMYWLQLVGRLRPDVTLERAIAMSDRRLDGLDPFVPLPSVEPGAETAWLPVSLKPLRTTFFEDQRGRNPVPLWALAVSGAVLLLACATVANLLLAQAVRRRREIAVRMAIGSSMGRILRAQVTESVLLASAALLLAAVLARASVGLLERLPVPPLGAVATGRSIAVGMAVTLLTPLVFGIAPVLWTARRHVGEVLREAGQPGITAASRAQHALMAAQMAVGFVLLLVAALFLQSLANVRGIDTGMDLERVLVVSLERPDVLPAPSAADLLEASLERIELIPGVEAAGRGAIVPFYVYSRGPITIADGRPEEEQPRSILVNTVDPGYLSALGIGVVVGRSLDERDSGGTPPVAMVSEALARAAWPGRSPVGACLRLRGYFGDGCVEVVGIATDATYRDLTGDPDPVLYLSAAQFPPQERPSRLFVRTSGAGADVAAAVRAELQALDPTVPYVDVQPLDARLRPELLRWEVGAALFTSLGALALLLAAVGLYSVISFGAVSRAAELGVRAALGAGRARLLRMEVWGGLRVTAVGVGAGSLVALAVARAFQAQLHGVGWLDVPTYACVGGLLAAVTVAAGLHPAWKASGADPVSVLRAD